MIRSTIVPGGKLLEYVRDETLASLKFTKWVLGHWKRLAEKFNPNIAEMIPSLEMAEPSSSPDLLSKNEEVNSSTVPRSLRAPPSFAVFPKNAVLSIRSCPTVLSIAPPAAMAKFPTNVQLRKRVENVVGSPTLEVLPVIPLSKANTAPPF